MGLTEQQATGGGYEVEVHDHPLGGVGRAIIKGETAGLVKIIVHKDGPILGATVVGPSAGDMICEVCLAIEMGADAVDIGKTIHPHPTLGETIGLAAEVAHGSCTDIPPMRRK